MELNSPAIIMSLKQHTATEYLTAEKVYPSDIHSFTSNLW